MSVSVAVVLLCRAVASLTMLQRLACRRAHVQAYLVISNVSPDACLPDFAVISASLGVDCRFIERDSVITVRHLRHRHVSMFATLFLSNKWSLVV